MTSLWLAERARRYTETQMGRPFADGVGIARDYVRGNREGQDWLLRYCDTNGIPVQREHAYTYAQSAREVAPARAELMACRLADLDAEWDTDADCPSLSRRGTAGRPGSIRSNAIVGQVDRRAHRTWWAARRRCEGVSAGAAQWPRTGGVRNRDGEVDVDAGQCVLATGMPILDRGGFFAGSRAVTTPGCSFRRPTCYTGTAVRSCCSPLCRATRRRS